MTKAAQREQRRAQRIARRNRQRAILAIIVVLAVAVALFFAVRDYQSRTQANATTTPAVTAGTSSGAYPIGTLDSKPPAPSANAVTTASGLVYEELQAGDGATAKAGDIVQVNYTGWLQDGTQFDSSLTRGQPFQFTLGAGQVITGWDEGVQGMKVNGTRLLVIPSTLGYGANGYPPTIPGNATLTFEVQLVNIVQPTPTP